MRNKKKTKWKMSMLSLKNEAENHCRHGPSFDHPLWQCSRTLRGPLEAPLSDDGGCARVVVVVCGVVRAGLWVLSLLVEEGRSTFGVCGRNLGQILKDYQR